MSRRAKIEAMLEETPEDLFLNYALAMELVKESDVPAARAAFSRVRTLNPDYVAAYFQEGQLLAQTDLLAESRTILQAGIDVAKRIGDDHALGEMSEFLESL